MDIETTKAAIFDADGNPTKKYGAYLKFQRQYQEKLNLQHEMQGESLTSPQKLHLWPIIGKQYNDDVNDAMSKWVIFGFKNEIETLLNELRAQGVNLPDH